MTHKEMLKVIYARIRYLIQRSEEGIGIGQYAMNRVRCLIAVHMGAKALAYLEHNIDARDGTWRVSSSFSWQRLSRNSPKFV